MKGLNNWHTQFLILCFSGPLVLFLWPVYGSVSPRHQALVREGTIYLAATAVFFFLFRILTELPLLGGLFRVVSIFYWMAYLACCIWIIVRKTEDMQFILPFISTHAERLEKKDVL
ncbi:MAG: hypothetical protein GXO69_05280 [Acidobacteria bacterium]|nr:hypothetical protein [Acidobacteriota bacterium]